MNQRDIANVVEGIAQSCGEGLFANARFIAAARTDVPALCAAVRERDATIAKLEAEAETTARRAVLAVLDDGQQEIADLAGETAGTIADNVRTMFTHREREIFRLRLALDAASTDLAGSTDARAVMVRTGIDIVLAAVPGSETPDPRLTKLEAAARKVVNMRWDHGEDCPHRDCDADGCCSDGTVAEDDGCEATGQVCDCHVADRDALAGLLAAVPS